MLLAPTLACSRRPMMPPLPERRQQDQQEAASGIKPAPHYQHTHNTIGLFHISLPLLLSKATDFKACSQISSHCIHASTETILLSLKLSTKAEDTFYVIRAMVKSVAPLFLGILLLLQCSTSTLARSSYNQATRRSKMNFDVKKQGSYDVLDMLE